MKKLVLAFSILAVSFLTLMANAEEVYTYSELFEEGKTWNVVEEYFNASNNESYTVNKQISFNREWNDGDHLLKEVNCFNSKTNISSPHSYLEENKTISTKDSKSFRTMIDFNLTKGDVVAVEDGEDGMDGNVVAQYYVTNDEIIEIKGIKRRILSIASEKDGTPFTYWIEGIGSVDSWIMLVYPQPTCLEFLKSRRISSCYLGDKCIFEYKDLEDYMSKSGINSADNGPSLIREGRVWEYVEKSWETPLSGIKVSKCSRFQMHFNGTESINGSTYHKFVYTGKQTTWTETENLPTGEKTVSDSKE